MKDCIFCQIVAGKIPCYKVYEDKNFLGFLDIAPLNPGHCLIIPKKHFRWVYDVPNFGKYFEAARKVAVSINEVQRPEFVCFLTWGIDVPHAHIQLIPRFENDGHDDGIRFSARKKIPEEKMREIAKKIRKRVRI